jgi:hypothetical protein
MEVEHNNTQHKSEHKMSEQKTLKYFMLNNLGTDYIYQAENEEEATRQYILEVCNASTIEEYEAYCYSIDRDEQIDWKECGKHGFTQN